MTIFEFAMKMEKDGEAYYREMAEKCRIPGLKHILLMLAEDEVRHYDLLKNMKQQAIAKMAGSTVIKEARNVFAGLRGKKNYFDLQGSEVELYKKAIEIEKQSEDFYREKCDEVDTDEAGKLLMKLADEEKIHSFLLENMVVFLSRPETWLEDAEFNHLEEY